MLQRNSKKSNFLHIFVFVLLLLFTFFIYFHTDTSITQDLGRHLTLGKLIVQTKNIPKTNLFSYTHPDFPFINHHWGSEVIFYFVDNIFSIQALIIMKLIIIFTSISILGFYSLKKSFPVFVLFSGVLALEIMRNRTEVRPEIFGYLFFSLFLVFLSEEREKQTNAIWLLPILMIFWVNFHITFVFGLFVFSMFFLDRLLAKKINIKYFIVGLLVFAVVLLNPFFLKGAVYPFQILNNYGYSIVENQSILFLEKVMSSGVFVFFKTGIFLILITGIFLLRRNLFELGVCVVMGVLSLTAVRHFPFFALSLIFPLSFSLTLFSKQIINSAKDKKIKDYFLQFRFSLLVVLIIFVFFEISKIGSNVYYIDIYSLKRFGLGQVNGVKGAVDFFKNYNLQGPIFNNFDIGSFLIYRLYPENKVFVDGRPEAYPASFFQKDYIPMQKNLLDWGRVYEKYKFNTIIFSHTDQTPWARTFLTRMLRDIDWSLVYFDDFALILVKNDALGDDVGKLDSLEKIEEWGTSLLAKTSDKGEIMRLGKFFSLGGYKKLEELADIKLMRKQY